jgi:succinate dehydrogenase/fumarate reductase flavoprotein subunit
MFAVVSAAWAGASAAKYVAEVSAGEIDSGEAGKIKDMIFGPMQSKNKYSPIDAISVLGDITAPMKYNLRRSRDRLEEALAMIETLKGNLPSLNARDLHYLSKCHEVKSMAICAELTFKAALMRSESRGFHFREDYPERDDENWLKWIILQQVEGEMKLTTQQIPIEKYKIRPKSNL